MEVGDELYALTDLSPRKKSPFALDWAY